jgi:hypothetical protein
MMQVIKGLAVVAAVIGTTANNEIKRICGRGMGNEVVGIVILKI